jgi:hypothetical protein
MEIYGVVNAVEVEIKEYLMKVNWAIILLLGMSALCHAKELYRAPSAEDGGSYWVLSKERLDGGLVEVITSHIWHDNSSTSFIKLRINCASEAYLMLAISNEKGIQEFPTKPLREVKNPEWESRKASSDLIQFVCKK